MRRASRKLLFTGSGMFLPELCQKRSRSEPEDIQKLARIHSAAIDTLPSTLITVDALITSITVLSSCSHISQIII